MAAIKRRADDEPSTSKKSSRDANEPAAKRFRKSASSADTKDRSTEDSKPAEKPQKKRPAATSVLQSEGKSFPRGGGSVLTPLEHKQIQIQATNDVLFEQSGSKRKEHAQNAADEDSLDGAQEKPQKPTKKKKSSVKSKTKEIELTDEPVTKIESLSFKKLVPGTLVLGQISRITTRDLVLALPNNLSGYVPLTSISEKLNQRLEKLLESEGNVESEAGSDDEDDIELKSLFEIGQYIRACVTSNGGSDADASSTKKRIELSIDPREANRGLTKEDIVVHNTIQAAVLSNEEHGLVMDLGLNDKTLRGFLPAKELPPDTDHAEIEDGTVFMCLVTGNTSDGRIVKLSANHPKLGNVKKTNFLTDAPTIDAFLPGTAVELLITENSAFGLSGKIMGMLDTTADIVHSGAAQNSDYMSIYKVGTKHKARIICTYPASDLRKVGVSLLPHLIHLSSPGPASDDEKPQPLETSSFVTAKVVRVEPGLGLFLDVGVPEVYGFAHISRLSDRKIENLPETSGPYAVGTSHRARILGYNAIDGLHVLSLEDRILEQPFLQLEDVKVGQVVKGNVEKLKITPQGAVNLIVRIADGISGLVRETHLADAMLKHPDKKFQEGTKVTARVLSIDIEKRQFRLTLKKSLVNSEASVWDDYETISVGDQAPGTIARVLPTGAKVEFYGNITAFLPKQEMSEAFIDDPARHFKAGQVVNVRVTSIDPTTSSMKVSCKDPSAVSSEQKNSFKSLSVGQIVDGPVLEKSGDAVTVELDGGVKGIVKQGMLTDGSAKKEESAFQRLRVGSKLTNLVVLRKHENRIQVDLTSKPSLVAAAKSNSLVSKFEDVREGETVQGFVRNFDPSKVFIEFAGSLVGALFKSQIDDEMLKQPNFGLHIGKSISARVSYVDYNKQRFLLSAKPAQSDTNANGKSNIADKATLAIGTIVQVTVNKIMETQVLVTLDDESRGRIDISEVFDRWDDISDKKKPLSDFSTGQKLKATVLGTYNAKNYRYLPFSHRQSVHSILELTTKNRSMKSQKDLLTLESLDIDSEQIGFINRIEGTYAWLNISPTVKGRLDLLQILNDATTSERIQDRFPIGTAMRVTVQNVDVEKARLDLVPVVQSSAESLTWDTLTEGVILQGRVTSSTERFNYVQLARDISGIIPLTEMADDYYEAKTKNLLRQTLIRVKVVHVDKPNKKVTLSTRPSNILDSGIKPIDRQILRNSDLKVNDVVRGFVKNIAEKGVYIALGPFVTGFVKVSDLSDSFIKDWKSAFQIDQLVKAKVLDPSSSSVTLSLKNSILDKDYVPPISWADLQEGQIVSGTIRKVLDFGVIVLVDNSANVSGLCYKTEIADERVEDLPSLYSEGDKVKAVVKKITQEEGAKPKVSFSMKASNFEDEDDEDDDSEMDTAGGGVGLVGEDGDEDDMEIDPMTVASADEDQESGEEVDVDMEDNIMEEDPIEGLDTSGFDWAGANIGADKGGQSEDDESDDAQTKKKRKRKPGITEDKTDALDKNGPQSVADFERLLLGSPDDSLLWIRYMAFQASLNEIDKARDIGQRALRTISMKDQEAKMDVRTALLNLETQFGTDDTVEEVFKDACEVHGPYEVHNRLVDIYIKENKLEKADDLFQAMTKIKDITPHPQFWISYATFLLNSLNVPDRARALLSRATQSVDARQHRDLTAKFGALEFKSPNGDAERGRTTFEQLLNLYPKKWDLWDMYLALEKAHGGEENVRGLFERMSKGKMKARRAQLVFSKWRDWEEGLGNKKGIDRVRALEEQWEEKRNAVEEEE